MNLLEKLDQESDVVEELRHHLELVLEGFVGGSLDSTPIGKIFLDPAYQRLVSEFRPRLDEAFVAFLSALLYALKTSLIDIGLIDHRAYDLSAAHESLKNVVNSLKSASRTWLSKLSEDPEMVVHVEDDDVPVDDQDDHEIDPAKGSLTYERALAMSCINKVVISSLKKSSNATIPEQKLGGDYSYESTTSLTVYCDGVGGDENWKTTSRNNHDHDHFASVDVKSDLLKKFCAGSAGGVPFPEYGVDIVDSTWDRTSSSSVQAVHEVSNEAGVNEETQSKTSSVAMTSTDWEDNWLFRKKPLNRSGAFNLEPVEMVIPKPNRPEGVTLGSLEIDALSELSENNSVASLDFSSSESESDRPQVTGAVMKPQVKSTPENSTVGLSKVTISDQTTSERPSATTVVTVNGVSDRVLIEQQQHRQLGADVTVITGGPPHQKAPPTSATKKALDEKPLVGLRAKASFDGKVVMENIDDVKERAITGSGGGGGGTYYKSKDSVESSDRRTPLGRSATSYDELSVRAFKEETLHSLEQRFQEFEEHVDNTGTTSSLKSLSEEDLDIHTSVSTDFSFRRSPEGCSKSNTPNITSMFIGKSASPEDLGGIGNGTGRTSISPGSVDVEDNNKSRVEDIVRTLTKSALEKSQNIQPLVHGTRMMTNKETHHSTTNEEMVSVSISSGRGSTASTTSASSVQSYELLNHREQTISRLSEASIDRDRSISAEPAQDPAQVIFNPLASRAPAAGTTGAPAAVGALDERPSSSAEQSHEQRPSVNVTDGLRASAAAVELQETVGTTTERTTTQAAAVAGSSPRASSTSSATEEKVDVVDGSVGRAGGRHEGSRRTPELDRDQDIYCVLPAQSKLEVVHKQQRSTMQRFDREIEQRIQRFQSNTLPNPKRRSHFRTGGDGDVDDEGTPISAVSSSMHPIPAKRNLLKLNSSQREVNIYPPSSSPAVVDTIPVPKNRSRSFTQVFPHRPLALAPEQAVLAEADEPEVVPLRMAKGASFGVQIYPAPAPQPRPRRSPGGVDAMRMRTPSPAANSQDIGISSMKKAVIEKDLRDKLPNVRRLASRFREPVRPGDYQSATLPAPSRRRREVGGRKDAVELNNRLSHFDSFS